MTSSPPAPLLDVRDLTVRFTAEGGLVHAVDGVSFEMPANRPGKVRCFLYRGETRASGGAS